MTSAITLEAFQEAVDILGLVGKIDRQTVRQVYLLLCREFHPDMPTGDPSTFQKINDAYELIEAYMNQYRFDFDQAEFTKQYPLFNPFTGIWTSGKIN